MSYWRPELLEGILLLFVEAQRKRDMIGSLMRAMDYAGADGFALIRHRAMTDERREEARLRMRRLRTDYEPVANHGHCDVCGQSLSGRRSVVKVCSSKCKRIKKARLKLRSKAVCVMSL